MPTSPSLLRNPGISSASGSSLSSSRSGLHGAARHPTSIARVSAVELADRKSTRLNSRHVKSSYAVFCFQKKKQQTKRHLRNYHALPITGIDSTYQR